MSKAGNGPLTERLFASLTSVGQADSTGAFTLDPEIARERIRSARFANPLRYVLELVQAAVQKGATNVSFRFGSDGVHMHFDGEPFEQSDFEALYTSLLLKPETAAAHSRRLLALGVCTALQLEPSLIRIESGDAFLELRPGHPDRMGTLSPLVALTHIHLRHRLHLGLLKRYVDRLGGHLSEETLLDERCIHARVQIEVQGKRISQGYVLPDVRMWRTFAENGLAGVVGVAPVPPLPGPNSSKDRDRLSTPESMLSSTYLRLVTNGVWVDTQLPIELLPGFRALAESSGFRLDIAREHVVQDQNYSAMLRAVAATQVELLATLCRMQIDGQLVADGQTMIEGPHLRALLRGLLWRLGGLAPLLRWAGRPLTQFPASSIHEGSPFWPAHIVDGPALLGVPVFTSTMGEPVPLSRLFDDFAAHGSVAYSAFRSREPDHKRPLVLYAAEPTNQDLLRTMFGSALECRDGAIAAAWERERNRVAFMRRVYRPQLYGQSLMVRAKLTAPQLSGELGLEPQVLPRTPWERQLYRPPQLRLLLIKDGCLLVEKTGPFAVPGVTVAVLGDFTPSYLFDDVLSDTRLGAVIDAVLHTLPSLIEQVANTPLPLEANPLEGRNAPPLDPQLRGRAWTLRALLMLALSPEARAMARSALGLSPQPADSKVELDLEALGLVSSRSSDAPLEELEPVNTSADTPFAGIPAFTQSLENSNDNEMPAHLRWVQLRDWPLFETLDGVPLRPRDLEEAAARYGYLAVLCPSPSVSKKRLERWAALCRNDGAPAEVWQKAYAMCQNGPRVISPSPSPPPFVLWLSPLERPLRDIIKQQLPPTRIIDAEPWLRTVSALYAVHEQKPIAALQLLDPCVLSVPLSSVEGSLGVLQAQPSRAHMHEPRLTVPLYCKRQYLGNQEIYLPGGQYLAAIADHPRLRLDDELLHVLENDALPAVRRAMALALPDLLGALVQRPLPWPPMFRLLLLDVAAALFPRPVFRTAYDVLSTGAKEARRGLHSELLVDPEDAYASILRLAVATSIERVEAVLEQLLQQDGPLPLERLSREVLAFPLSSSILDDENEITPPISMTLSSELLHAAEPPEGAMAFIDTLYPLPPSVQKTGSSSPRVTFAERALNLLPALAIAPILASPEGAPLTLLELIEDFREHGHILHAAAAAAPGDAPRRPVVFDPSALLLPVLHCLFGEDHVREASGPTQRALAPPLSTMSWPMPLHAAGLLDRPLGIDSESEGLLSAVVAELRELGADTDRLLSSANLAWLQLDDSDEPLAVVCDARHFIINRRHPAVQRALLRFRDDPQCVRFLASAAYTALAARLEAQNHEDAATFYQHLVVRALATAQPPAPAP